MPRQEDSDAEDHREEEERDLDDKPENGGEEDPDDDPPSGDGLSEEIYEVESIISHMYKRGELYFKVRWKNYTAEYDTLEPASNLTSASLAIQEYWKDSNNTPDKPKGKNAAPSKGKKESSKKTTPKSANKTSTSSSRSRKVEKKSPSEEKEPPSDKEEDEDYDNKQEAPQSSRKKRPVSKGALKAYESPKASTTSNAGPAVMSTPKQIAIESRSAWLFESDESDNEDTAAKAQVAAKKEPVKRKAKEPSPVQAPAKKAANHDSDFQPTNTEASSDEPTADIIGVFDQSGVCKIVIADGGEEKLIALKDAHQRFGFALVSYLADKVVRK